MPEILHLNPDVLAWAAAQIGGSVAQIAFKISKTHPERIMEGVLSGAQAAKFAQLTGTPFGYLFFDSPPAGRVVPIADFRTLQRPEPLSKNFFDTFDDLDFKQNWYRETLAVNGAPALRFIGKYRTNSDIVEVASDMRAVLNLTQGDFAVLGRADQVFSMLAEKAESAGILVFKNSIVGGNATRPLSVAEFRGFALCDQHAPCIFINGADAPTAWVFTLAHELAHLWLGASGISDAAPSSANRTEERCNKIAAEFLVPREDFLALWERYPGQDACLEATRKEFKVSSLVIARRAFELGLINAADYRAHYEAARMHAAKPKAPGGDFYRTLAVRNSKRFSMRVARLAASGALSLRLAGQLLNTNPNNVMTFYAKQSDIPS